MIVNTDNKYTKIIFGNSKRKNINKIINSKKNILLVCSKRGKKEIYNDKKFNFINKNKIFLIDEITPNPSIIQIKSILKKLKIKDLILLLLTEVAVQLTLQRLSNYFLL